MAPLVTAYRKLGVRKCTVKLNCGCLKQQGPFPSRTQEGRYMYGPLSKCHRRSAVGAARPGIFLLKDCSRVKIKRATKGWFPSSRLSLGCAGGRRMQIHKNDGP